MIPYEKQIKTYTLNALHKDFIAYNERISMIGIELLKRLKEKPPE